MRELIEGLRSLPVYPFRGKRIILTGIMAEPKELLYLFQENGMAVVADDLAQESRQYRTDIPDTGGNAIRRLALQWINRYGCSLAHSNHFERGDLLIDLCNKSEASGVVACMMKFCDPEEYDFPTYKAQLAQKNIPTLFLEIDLLNTSYEQARTRIETYAEML